jgi:hypothetical protein
MIKTYFGGEPFNPQPKSSGKGRENTVAENKAVIEAVVNSDTMSRNVLRKLAVRSDLYPNFR